MHPSRISLSSAFLLALLAATPLAHAASTCPANNVLTTPTADFTDNTDGTVTHLKTGLMWKQCAEGLSGAGCATGGSTFMTWSAALSAAATPFAGYSDWRLPNQKELRSIVETGCYNPNINETAFPATPSAGFWSSTAYASLPAFAWVVFFSSGDSSASSKADSHYVRLVRGGQSFDSFDAQKTNQTITFANPGAQVLGSSPTLSATASSNLTPVTFTSSTTGVCTITSGGTLTLVTTGTCTISADQAGDGSYNAAPQVMQSFAITAPVVATTAIPTLSEWGMILLAGMLGLFGMGVMRRRSRVE